MNLVENIIAVSDHFLMPAKVLSHAGERSAEICIPGKRPVQVKAALEVLRKRGLVKNISCRQLEASVQLTKLC